MYDELVKRLRDDEAWKNCDFDFIYDWMHQAADAIEELSKQLDGMNEANIALPKWIPVMERLPEHSCGESNSCLTVSSLGAMRVLYFDGGNWCYPTGEALTTAGMFPITHWQPLPEPPKEE